MQYNNIMQDIAFYDMEGLLSEDIRETVCDIVCSIEPAVYMIDYIDIDGIIQAVDRGVTVLEDVYDVLGLQFDNQKQDWYTTIDISSRTYLNIGPVTKTQACSYLARLRCDNAFVEIVAISDYRNNSVIRHVIVKDMTDEMVVTNYQL